MFDSDTNSLIRSAPPLPNLDLESLPELLSEFYVDVVSLRLAFASNSYDEVFDKRIKNLRELAVTYASYVAAGVLEDQATAAAFVSGTAFRLLSEISKSPELGYEIGNRFLINRIPDGIVAIPLLMLSGYPTDAIEVAKNSQQKPSNESESESLLRRVICSLGSTNFEKTIAAGNEAAQLANTICSNLQGGSADSRTANDLLLLRIAEGCAMLASQLLGDSSDLLLPNAVFAEVRDLAYEDITTQFDGVGNENSILTSTFSGAHLLSSLLLRLPDDLVARSVVSIPPPSGVDHMEWNGFMGRLATKRPLLWENHQKAIADGFLNAGTSAAMTFPTGAGKSTVSELKIGAHLYSGGKVIFLAPTHALSSQVQVSLAATFSEHDIHDSIIGDGFYAEINDEDASFADVTVMTPERCLMLLDLYPSAFLEIGLLVMDECHILNPSRGIEDRRAVDAMLALLRTTAASPKMDVVLLSAMVSNASELAEWLEDLLQRPCLSFESKWKPTRQAKGCLVFDSDEMSKLESLVNETELGGKTIGPPVALKRKLKAMPIGFFSLTQNWSGNASNYHSCPIMSEPVQLDCNKSWEITNDKNSMAGTLSSHFASSGIKTIVFSQNKAHCESISDQIDDLSASAIYEFSSRETRLRKAAINEAGGDQYAILPRPKGAVCHHGLLSPVERALSESVFRRRSGGATIVATPTLAQGMNLPAEAVIIAGTKRYDASSKGQSVLEAHELLNAAGRSGRAGFRPEGIVVVITDKPISFQATDKGKKLLGDFHSLRKSIFSKEDQCLHVIDPIQLMLDAISQSQQVPLGTPAYFLNRLPAEERQAEKASVKLLSRTLGFFLAKKRSEDQAYKSKIELAAATRNQMLISTPAVTWMDRLASSNGLPAIVFQQLGLDLSADPHAAARSVTDWIKWIFWWFGKHPLLCNRLLRMKPLEQVFGKSSLNKGISKSILTDLESMTLKFINGAKLIEIESLLPTRHGGVGTCHRTRNFIQSVGLDLSYTLGLIPQTHRALHASSEDVKTPLAMGVASACMRAGFCCPEQLAVSIRLKSEKHMEEQTTRVGVHEFYRKILPSLSPSENFENFKALQAHVSAVVDIELEFGSTES